MAANQIYRTVVGNDAPDIQFTLERNDVAINVTGAAVELALRYLKNNTTYNATKACTLTTPASGIVTYSPAVADFPYEGLYIGDAKITYSDGTIEHVYEVLTVLARGGVS
jgi:hypothetical protein